MIENKQGGSIMPDSTIVRVKVGDRVVKIMPHSEVCIHMGIAGKPMVCEILRSPCGNGGCQAAVQLYDLDNNEFSFPILESEAGFYWDYQGKYLYFPRYSLAQCELSDRDKDLGLIQTGIDADYLPHQ